MTLAEEEGFLADNTEGSLRWWESYAVRYGVGSIVGAIVVYFVGHSNPDLTPLLLFDTAQLSATQLILLAGYGFAYCYIASAPILVFHAGRFLLNPYAPTRQKLTWFALSLGFPALLAFVGWRSSRLFIAPEKYFYLASGCLIILVVWMEIVVICLTLWKHRELCAFYDTLASKRQRPATRELTISYRHLREHGNAFFIVLLEVLLGIGLYIAGVLFQQPESQTDASAGSRFQLMIIAIWILPAVLVWIAANLVERRFQQDE